MTLLPMLLPTLSALPAVAAPLVIPVPVDHDEPDGPTLELVLERFPAPSGAPAPGQLWHITGGPGDSGLNAVQRLTSFQEAVAPDYELWTLDVRGVGQSDRLGCPAQEDPGSDEGRAISPEEWPDCVDALDPDGLQHLTTTQTARDLIAAIEATRGEGPVVLWGVSYGTFLVDRVLAIDPTVADAVILDGVVPPDWSFLEFDVGLDQVARSYAGRCAEDPDCAARLGPDPEDAAAFAEGLIADLNDGHCRRLGLDAEILRILGGVFLMGAEQTADQIPVVWHRLARCKPRDVRAFVHLFDTLFPEGEGDQEDPSHAPVLQRQIAYTDLWGVTPPQAELERVVEASIATTAVTRSFGEIAEDWPLTDPGPFHQAPPATDVPVLALHGGFDPTMPLERALDRAAWLDGPGQQFVTVPEAFHVTLNQGACPADLYAQFLADPRAELDLSCIGDMPRLGFPSDPERDEAIWGTPDRWGERGCSTAGGVFGVFGDFGGWVLLPMLGLIRRRTA